MLPLRIRKFFLGSGALIEHRTEEPQPCHKFDDRLFCQGLRAYNAQHPVAIFEVYATGIYYKLGGKCTDDIVPILNSCNIGAEYS